MAIRRRIEDLSRPGYYENRNTALLMIRDCSAVWVEEGISIRRLDAREIYDARVAQSARREQLATPLPYGELPGFLFQPPVSGTIAARASRRLMWEAHKFAAGASAAFTG